MTRRKPTPKRKPVTLRDVLTAAQREGLRVEFEVAPKLSPHAALLAACQEWDRRFVAAREAGLPMSEADCDEAQRVRARLRVEERVRAKGRERDATR